MQTLVHLIAGGWGGGMRVAFNPGAAVPSTFSLRSKLMHEHTSLDLIFHFIDLTSTFVALQYEKLLFQNGFVWNFLRWH